MSYVSASAIDSDRTAESAGSQGNRYQCGNGFGGGKRARTADLLAASQTLSQLSYTPTKGCRQCRQARKYSTAAQAGNREHPPCGERAWAVGRGRGGFRGMRTHEAAARRAVPGRRVPPSRSAELFHACAREAPGALTRDAGGASCESTAGRARLAAARHPGAAPPADRSTERINRGPTLRPARHRSALAEPLEGARRLPHAGHLRQAQVLLPRLVPVSLGRRPLGRPLPQLRAHRRRSRATSACAASTCCTRWAGTPSACRPRTTPSRRACIRAGHDRAQHRQLPPPDGADRPVATTGRARSVLRPRVLPLDAMVLPADVQARPGLPRRPASSGGARDKTILANEQVDQGRCWRCGSEVTKKDLEQWFFKITDYAQRLLDDLDDDRLARADQAHAGQLDRPQRGRRGRLRRCRGRADTLTVFTTRPDTLFGATFMVLAPEHPLVGELTTPSSAPAVAAYQDAGAPRERDRAPLDREGEDRRLHRRLRREPRQRRADPHLDQRLRADGLRHRRDHGRAGARRARLRSSPPSSACRSSR